MILITVGTEKFPFDRLMNWIDRLIENKFIDPDIEEVIVQYGSCQILPRKAKSYSLLPEIQFKTLLPKARVIIAHCGEGTFDLLATIDKPFVLVPRGHRFGEHVDDHQIEMAEKLSERGVPIARSIGELARFLESPKTVTISSTPTAYYARTSQILEKEFARQSLSDRVKLRSRVIEIFSRFTPFRFP